LDLLLTASLQLATPSLFTVLIGVSIVHKEKESVGATNVNIAHKEKESVGATDVGITYKEKESIGETGTVATCPDHQVEPHILK
jgi:hypothetical protein